MDSTPVSKLVIKISLSDDIRRVSVDPKSLSFETLKSTVKRLYKTLSDEDAQYLVIRYQDDESDWVTVSSDEELSEALSLVKEDRVLRLNLAIGQAPCYQRWRGHKQRHHQEGPGQCGKMGGWKRWCQQQGDKTEQGPEQQGQPEHHQEGPGHCGRMGGWKRWCQQQQGEQGFGTHPEGHGHGYRHHQEGAHGHGWRRWWQQQQGEQGTEHHQEGPCGRMGGMKRVCGGRGKFFFLQQQALRLMQTGAKEDIQTARELFRTQLSMFEHCIPMYNIACCEALLGNSKESLEFLQKAVVAGYRDADHLEKDEDLKSLRPLDEFKALVLSLKQNVTTAVSVPVATTELTPSAPVEIIAPAPFVPVEIPSVQAPAQVSGPSASPADANLALLFNMGFSDQHKNAEALAFQSDKKHVNHTRSFIVFVKFTSA